MVLVRSEMSLPDIPEAREVVAEWLKAVDAARPEDFLDWRQRLGPARGALVTMPEPTREYVMHHLLCALRNGDTRVARGDGRSPDAIHIGRPGKSVELALRPYGTASSWGGSAQCVRAVRVLRRHAVDA